MCRAPAELNQRPPNPRFELYQAHQLLARGIGQDGQINYLVQWAPTWKAAEDIDDTMLADFQA